jgi:starch synthase
MKNRLSVLHVASEVAPFSKTGGLGDVAAALPRALARAGATVRVVTPRYRTIDPRTHVLARRLTPLSVTLGAQTESIGLFEGTLPGGVVPVTFLDHALYDRDGLYGDGAKDYPDNGRRFALLCRAALELCHRNDWWPDVVHAHDWQAGLAILLAARGAVAGRPIPRTVFTVHNLAFQGLVDKTILDEVGISADLFTPAGLEFYGKVSLLKAGLAYADRITTVSPRYAREIQTPELGAGLDGFLRERAAKIVGILNGIDTDVWSPERDPMIPARFDAIDRTGKTACKAALQREVGLPVRPNVPLIGSVSRLTEQKGFDLIAQAHDELGRLDAQFVFLGAGEARYQSALEDLARRYPTKFALRIAYDEPLAHRIEAGSDLFLMPSRFEPCGLNQLYSLRYGTLPIVRSTGGLDDSVVDYDDRSATGTGFKFTDYGAEALLRTIRRGLAVYQRKREWHDLVGRVMGLDYGWDRSARLYLELYQKLVDGARAEPSAA